MARLRSEIPMGPSHAHARHYTRSEPGSESGNRRDSAPTPHVKPTMPDLCYPRTTGPMLPDYVVCRYKGLQTKPVRSFSCRHAQRIRPVPRLQVTVDGDPPNGELVYHCPNQAVERIDLLRRVSIGAIVTL